MIGVMHPIDGIIFTDGGPDFLLRMAGHHNDRRYLAARQEAFEDPREHRLPAERQQHLKAAHPARHTGG